MNFFSEATDGARKWTNIILQHPTDIQDEAIKTEGEPY